MSPLTIAALLSTGAPAATGPDAARISELDWSMGQILCQEYYHVVPCRSWRHIVSDVGCTPVEGEASRVFCTYVWRIPHVRRSAQNCSGQFVRAGATWTYAPAAESDPSVYTPMSRRYEGPLCSDRGTPTAPEIAAVRARAYPRLSCVHYSSPHHSCPAAGPAPREVRCNWGYNQRASCEYRLDEGANEHFCRTTFRRHGRDWAMTGRRSRDGRFVYDENCNLVRRSG